MRQQIAVARSLAPQIRRHEVLDLRERALGPAGPLDLELFADPLEGARRITEKIIPADHRPAHISRSGLGVQHVAQPDETAEAERNAVAPLER